MTPFPLSFTRERLFVFPNGFGIGSNRVREKSLGITGFQVVQLKFWKGTKQMKSSILKSKENLRKILYNKANEKGLTVSYEIFGGFVHISPNGSHKSEKFESEEKAIEYLDNLKVG